MAAHSRLFGNVNVDRSGQHIGSVPVHLYSPQWVTAARLFRHRVGTDGYRHMRRADYWHNLAFDRQLCLFNQET